MYAKYLLLLILAVSTLGSWQVEAVTTKRVLAWGSNEYGLLLQGNDNTTKVPVVLSPQEFDDQDVISISAGSNFVVAANNAGAVFTWGVNTKGQLGNNTVVTSSSNAVQVSSMPEPIIQVASTLNTGLALSSSGNMWSWGSNERGVLGNGTNVPVSGFSVEPVAVLNNETENGKAVWIGCGILYCGYQTDSHDVFMWGISDNGQLGRNTGNIVYVTLPAKVNTTSLGNNHYFTQLSFGGYHTLALTDDGRVMAWGANSDGQLGVIGITSSPWPVPANFTAPRGDGVVQVSAGSAHSLILTGQGSVFGWGLSQFLQLGPTPSPTIQVTPFQFDTTFIWGNVISIHAYSDSSFATSDRGRFYGWGSASNYILGSNTLANSYGPLKVNQSNLPTTTYTVASFTNSGFAQCAFAVMQDVPLPPVEITPTSTPSADQEPPPFFPQPTPPTQTPSSNPTPVPQTVGAPTGTANNVSPFVPTLAVIALGIFVLF